MKFQAFCITDLEAVVSSESPFPFVDVGPTRLRNNKTDADHRTRSSYRPRVAEKAQSA